MPYCIWVTKATSYATRHEGAPLDRAELDDLLTIMEATEHEQDGARWLTHPNAGTDDAAWCSVFVHPQDDEEPLRAIELSTSYAHAFFPRNMADMFDLGLRIAKRLGARVFEESRALEVTQKSIDNLLDVDGDFARSQISFWQSGRKRLLSEMQAPLEFPLGAFDQMSDYFLFEFFTSKAVPLDVIAAATPSHLEAHVLQNSVVLEHRESGEGAVRIGRYNDGYYVRPFWSDLPFATLAQEVLGAVDRVAASLGTRASYFGNELDPTLRELIIASSRGSGCEFVEKMGLLEGSS